MAYPGLVERLIEQFVKLPGVGRRSAERMVFWMLNATADEAKEFARAIVELKEHLQLCRICNHLSEQDICTICSNPARDRSVLCVVEDHKHLLAIERTGTFKGLYYVLLGALAPSEGRGPEDLNLDQMVRHIRDTGISEVVLAMDPDTEGEMTAIHLTNVLRPLGVKISRIGVGIPVGSSVEYADMSTLAMSMSSRREL